MMRQRPCGGLGLKLTPHAPGGHRAAGTPSRAVSGDVIGRRPCVMCATGVQGGGGRGVDGSPGCGGLDDA